MKLYLLIGNLAMLSFKWLSRSHAIITIISHLVDRGNKHREAQSLSQAFCTLNRQDRLMVGGETEAQGSGVIYLKSYSRLVSGLGIEPSALASQSRALLSSERRTIF